MDGDAHQRAGERPMPFERARQGRSLEIAHPRPEGDVARWGVLRLKARDALHGACD
jgi:hypothetical protein